MTPEEGEEYIRLVWEAYEQLTNPKRLMSAIEFSMVRHWRETGVPLRVVLRGLKDTKKPGKNLLYYEKSVEEAMAHWEKAMSL